MPHNHHGIDSLQHGVYVSAREKGGETLYKKVSCGIDREGKNSGGKISPCVVAMQGLSSRGTLATLGGKAAMPAGEGGWGSTFKVSRPRSSRMGRRLTSWNGSSSSPDLTTRKSGEWKEVALIL